MADYEFELKIYDVSTNLWITFDHDNIDLLRASRTLTDEVGDFNFTIDVSAFTAAAEDVVIINIGELGQPMERWFAGQIEECKEVGERDDKYFQVIGKEISRVLLNNVITTDYSQVAQDTMIKSVVSDITYSSIPDTAITDEPIYVSQYDVAIALAAHSVEAAPTIIIEDEDSAAYTVTTDYTVDIGNGTVTILSTGAIPLNSLAYATYETAAVLPFGRVVGGTRQIYITTDSVAAEVEEVTSTVNGFSMWDAIKDVMAKTTTIYDFFLDPRMDLTTVERFNGTIRTYTVADDSITSFETFDSSSLILNTCRVTNDGNVTGLSVPSDGDAYTWLTAAVIAAGATWSATTASTGCFDACWFSDTPAQATDYGGVFTDVYVGTAVASQETTGEVVGTDYTKIIADADCRVMKCVLDMGAGMDFSDSSVKNNAHFFEYVVSGIVTGSINCTLQCVDTSGAIASKRFTPNTDAFPSTATDVTGTSGWTYSATMDWSNIQFINFIVYQTHTSAIDPASLEFHLDGYYFGSIGTSAEYTDTSSSQSYGVKKTNGIYPYPIVDNTISDWYGAYQKAQAIVEQYKDPIPIIESVYFEDGEFKNSGTQLLPGDQIRIEKDNESGYYATVRIVSVEHTFNGSDMETSVECSASDSGFIAMWLGGLDSEIRSLEMGSSG